MQRYRRLVKKPLYVDNEQKSIRRHVDRYTQEAAEVH